MMIPRLKHLKWSRDNNINSGIHETVIAYSTANAPSLDTRLMQMLIIGAAFQKFPSDL